MPNKYLQAMALPRFEFTYLRVRYAIVIGIVTSLLLLLSSSRIWQAQPRSRLKAPSNSSDELRKSDNDLLAFLPAKEAEKLCNDRRLELYPHREEHRKIYDLILINTELDWLEIRLGRMYDQVDYFVLVEANTTFTNSPKPLYVQKNWKRFARFHDKMIRHTLVNEGNDFTVTWDREIFSRNAAYNQVLPYLVDEQKANFGDVIIVADVDEIPRPDALAALRNCDFGSAITIYSRMYYYSFQWLYRMEGEWPHPQATYYQADDTIEPNSLRGHMEIKNALYNAGWHCSYCFSTLEQLVNKVTSFSHSELDKPEFKDFKKIMHRVRNGLDFFDSKDEHFDRVENNQDIPEFLKINADIYKFALDRDPGDGNFLDYGASVFGMMRTQPLKREEEQNN